MTTLEFPDQRIWGLLLFFTHSQLQLIESAFVTLINIPQIEYGAQSQELQLLCLKPLGEYLMNKWEARRDLIFASLEFPMDMSVRISIDGRFYHPGIRETAWARISNVTWLEFPSQFYA